MLRELPQLIPAVSLSLSKASVHKVVSILTKPLGMLKDNTFINNVCHFPRPNIWEDLIMCRSEGDAQLHVWLLMGTVVTALKLDIHITNEISVFQPYTDLWILLKKSFEGHSIPIGVVEVRKPNSNLHNGCTHGQLYDYLKLLKLNLNLNFAIGILTNFNDWQVLWLHDNDGDAIAAGDIDMQQQSNHPTFTASTSDNSIPTLNLDELNNDNESDVEFTRDNDPRICSGTTVVSNKDSPEKVLSLLATTICKMYTVVQPLYTALISKNRELFLHTPETYFWVHSPWKDSDHLIYDKMPHRNSKHFYFLKEIGQGRHGRVWLACSSSRNVCAIKFYHTQKITTPVDAEREVNVWKRLGFNGSRVVTLASRCAVVMPYMLPCESMIVEGFEEMAKAAIERLSSLGLCHNSIRIANMGYYKTPNSKDIYISFLDLGSVVDCDQTEASVQMNSDLKKVLEKLPAVSGIPTR